MANGLASAAENVVLGSPRFSQVVFELAARAGHRHGMGAFQSPVTQS